LRHRHSSRARESAIGVADLRMKEAAKTRAKIDNRPASDFRKLKSTAR